MSTCTTAKKPWPLIDWRTCRLHLVTVLVLIAPGLGALAVERLRQQDARDAQGLLRDGGELGQRLLRLAGDPRAHLADAALDEHEERHEHDGDEGEPPVDEDHRDERRDDRDEVAEDARDGVGEHARHAADVVLQPRLDDAGLRAGEERELHRLQVIEQPHPEVARDAVADRRREPGLHDAEPRREQEQRDHQQHEPDEQRDVGAAAVDGEQCIVEDPLDDERRDDGDGRSRDHEKSGEGEPAEVRTEQGDHPAAEVRDDRRCGVEPLLRRDVDAAEGRAAGATAAAGARRRAFPARRRSCRHHRRGRAFRRDSCAQA